MDAPVLMHSFLYMIREVSDIIVERLVTPLCFAVYIVFVSISIRISIRAAITKYALYIMTYFGIIGSLIFEGTGYLKSTEMHGAVHK